MSTRHIAAEHADARDLTPSGSGGGALKRFRRKLASDGFTTDEGWRPKPGYLYTVVRAISARVNQNYDGWPSEELKKAYKTFIGKPVFVNHENHDPTKARGVVVAARYVENGMDKYVETVMEVDAGRFPKLAHEIKTGGLDSVSMGAEAGFTICSYCHNKATDLHDMCEHVQLHKGKTLSRFDKRTGKKEDVLVFESCHKISFFELSYVFEPADETAVASKVVVAGKHETAGARASKIKPPYGDLVRGVFYPHADLSTEDLIRMHGNLKNAVWEGRPVKEGLWPHQVRIDHHAAELLDRADAGDAEAAEWAVSNDYYKDPRLPDEAWDSFRAEGGFPEDPRLRKRQAGHHIAGDDLAVPAPPGTPTIDQSVIDSTPVVELSPATELTGYEAPGVPKQGFAADIAEITKMAGDCPPGMDCSRNMAVGLEQISKDSPNNPVNQVSSDPNGIGSPAVTPGNLGQPGGAKNDKNLLPGTQALNDKLQELYPGIEIGGYREDPAYPDEHPAGKALDFMTTDLELGNKALQTGWDNGADYAIWQNKMHYPDGTTKPYTGPNPHTDHVHFHHPGTAPTQRAAGKYTKEDFAAAGGKKPWETDTAKPERGPVEEADLREIEAMARQPERRQHSAGNLYDDYMDYMYGEYGSTDYDVPNHPMDVMYDEAHHGRGRTGPPAGPSGPGGPKLHRSRKTASAIPDQLKGLVSTWTPFVNKDIRKNPDQLEAPAPDPNLPVFVHFQIPAADKQRAALRYHLNHPNDPKHDPSRPTLPRAEAARLAEQPDLWSIEQTDPATGKRSVRGHTNQLHLTNVSFDISRGGQKATQMSGKKGVHAGVSGFMIPQPEEPLEYSNVEYNPFAHMDFVHRENQQPIGDPDDWTRRRGERAPSTPSGYRSNGLADHVHLSPDMSMYANRADNFGLEQPKIVFPPHPAVNAANPETVIPGIGPAGQHPEVAARTKDVMEKRRQLDLAKGRSVIGMRKIARQRALRLAYGETEAPVMVDTLREEGSAPEDDNNDFERYVDPPKELQDPDLSQAAQIDRQQEAEQADPGQTGVPGPAEGGPAPQEEQGNFITLKVPMPQQGPQVPQQAVPPTAPPPAMPPPGGPQQIAASVLDFFDGYYGRRIANWMDAIEGSRNFTPEEAADYRRQAARLSTLENGRELSTTSRNPQKGTANMARTSIASRNQVATAGRRQHFAEGPQTDGSPYGSNDQGVGDGKDWEATTPAPEPVDAPTDDAQNISNTEHNLVARVQQGREQLMRDARRLAEIQQRRAFDEAGGPVAEVVDPSVNTGPEGEALTGDGFVSANPNDGVVPTNPKDASLRAFRAFDGWLSQKTGKSSRRHTEATIKKAAAQFSREAGISPQALFPALGIVLREARKNDKKANTKGAKMRKRADEKLEVAAPDGRVDVEAPVENTNPAKSQESQFDIHDFGDNAGDNVAKPDLSTDQNWAPGEASKTGARVKTAGGLLAMRCAEGMISAGLEPDSRERKYQLAAEYEQMNRGLIQDRVALLERFAAVRQADLRKVASGSSRGAARSPIPAGMGGGTRTASAPQRLAAHDPRNDSSLFI